MNRFSTLAFRARLAVPGLAAVLIAASPAGSYRSVPYCAGPDPYTVLLVPTAHANGASGTVLLHFAESPFGVTVTADGHHRYDASFRATGLPRNAGALVVWAATPELDKVLKLGVVDDDGVLEGTIAFNKFLVFVTAEETADVERWAGPILLRGLSPSGRLHTMAGHGPYAAESCPSWSLGGRDVRESS